MTFGMGTNAEPATYATRVHDPLTSQEPSTSGQFSGHQTCSRTCCQTRIPLAVSLPEQRHRLPEEVSILPVRSEPLLSAAQWQPLLSMQAINDALKARPNQIKYDDIISRLTHNYGVRFDKLISVCDGFSYSTRSPGVKNPAEIYCHNYSGPFRQICKDSFLNLKENISELYLLTQILQLEWSMIDPDSLPPTYAEFPTENNVRSQTPSIARAIRCIFFLNLLSEFKHWNRIDLVNKLVEFIKHSENTHLKKDLLYLLDELKSKKNSRFFIEASKCQIQKDFLRHLSNIINKGQSCRFGVFRRYDSMNLPWEFIENKLIDTDLCTDFMSSSCEPALTISTITKSEIPAMEASQRIKLLLKHCKDRLGVDLSAMVQVFELYLDQNKPGVQDLIKTFIHNLPAEWRQLQQIFFNQNCFNAADRDAAFLLIWLLKAETKVTGISSQPPSYEATLDSRTQQDAPPSSISNNLNNLPELIVKEFLQSLYLYIVELKRCDIKLHLVKFCENNNLQSLLDEPGLTASTDQARQQPYSEATSHRPTHQTINNTAQNHRRSDRVRNSGHFPPQVQGKHKDRAPRHHDKPADSSVQNLHLTSHPPAPVPSPDGQQRVTDSSIPRQQSNHRKKGNDSCCIIV